MLECRFNKTTHHVIISRHWLITARRLLFYHAHGESEEFFELTGQLAQPYQHSVFSKRTAFFNGLKKQGWTHHDPCYQGYDKC